MWNLRGTRLFGLVACLAVVLVLTGASQLDAKKPPKPPEVQWQVAIPSEYTAGEEGCNLYGNGSSDYVAYENNDAVECVTFENLYGLIGPESDNVTSWADANDIAGEGLPDAPLDIFGPGEESGR